jgi:hypothetical protein
MTISLAFLAPKLVRAAMVGRAHLGEGDFFAGSRWRACASGFSQEGEWPWPIRAARALFEFGTDFRRRRLAPRKRPKDDISEQRPEFGDWRAREMAAKTAFVLEGAHQGSNLGPADRFAPILLPKSFWGVERKFLEPLVRFARGDVRDHIG